MKKLPIIFFAAASICLVACNSAQKADSKDSVSTTSQAEKEVDKSVPYEEAKNYFVKNTVPSGEVGARKIETQEHFDSYFGPAATMGENGMPTKIDFNTHFVIAILSPETDLKREDVHVGLSQIDSNIIVSFHEHLGEKMSFTTRGATILIVDKKYNGPVTLQETEEDHSGHDHGHGHAH